MADSTPDKHDEAKGHMRAAAMLVRDIANPNIAVVRLDEALAILNSFAPSAIAPINACAAELIEDLIERNKEWWRTKSHCAGEMRELGVPDDADATQVTMGDLYQLQKAIANGP